MRFYFETITIPRQILSLYNTNCIVHTTTDWWRAAATQHFDRIL